MLHLFDIDGTLMTSDGAGRRAFEHACAAVLGLADALAGVTLHGRTDPAILEGVCRAGLGRAATAAEEQAVFAAYLQQLPAELARPAAVRVLPGVPEVIDRLSARGALLGLATGNLERGAERKLTAAGLWHHFGFGGYGSDAAARADLVAVAIARAEVIRGASIPRRAIAVIGDTPFDIAAALAVGVRAVAVATGIHDQDTLRAAGAHEVHATLESYALAAAPAQGFAAP